MTLVVFLRAVNVGGARTFKPSRLPEELAGLDVTNIGAAGTYVVHDEPDPATVRSAIVEALPFETEVMVRPADEVLDLLAEDEPFGPDGAIDGAKTYISVLVDASVDVSELPIGQPEGDQWEVRIVRVEGSYAFSVRMPREKGRHYPNAIVEKELGVPATTRGWATVERIGRVVQGRS